MFSLRGWSLSVGFRTATVKVCLSAVQAATTSKGESGAAGIHCGLLAADRFGDLGLGRIGGNFRRDGAEVIAHGGPLRRQGIHRLRRRSEYSRSEEHTSELQSLRHLV